MNNLPIDYCRHLDATEVARRLQLPKDRETHKWGCPVCGSSDALHVYPGAGRGSHCFSCNTSLDAIDLVQNTDGLDFVDAIRWLAGQFGFEELLEEESDLQQSRRRRRQLEKRLEERREKRRRRQQKRRETRRSVFTRLWKSMSLGPQGADYVRSRNVPFEVADWLGIRSVESDEDWKNIRSGMWPDELKSSGLIGYRDGDRYPIPWRTPFLVIPYLHGHQIDLLRFRDLSGAGGPKYLSPAGHSPASPYQSSNAYQFSDEFEQLFVCEGELNALSVIYAGAPAVSSCGNGTWRAEWSQPFRWYSRVVVLSDGDEGGDRFAARVREATEEALGIDWTQKRLRRRRFADGMDANDVLVAGHLTELLDVA